MTCPHCECGMAYDGEEVHICCRCGFTSSEPLTDEEPAVDPEGDWAMFDDVVRKWHAEQALAATIGGVI